MRNPAFLWIIVVIMVVLDIYVYQAIKVIAPASSPRIRWTIILVYWTISVAAAGTLISIPYVHYDSWPKSVKSYVFSIILALFFSKLIASIILLIDDLRRGCMWIIGKLISNPSVEISQTSSGITRSAFLSWLGIGLGSTLFGTLLYGFSNKYRYQVRKQQLRFKNLPSGFKGLKILQISDIHSGSFMDKKAVSHGVDMIMKQNADIILFTGDIVNDHAEEMEGYMEVFSRLKAPMGIYSTLGNHDYGEYALPHGLTMEERTRTVSENVEKVKLVHKELGWRLLMNEHVIVEKNNDAIALIGIENWSQKGNFPKYGRMDLAYPGAENYPFKILMSHDPSHWDGQVRSEYSDIDLMLAGHTHGMQFGVEIPGFKWSPVQYMYKQWAGLYEEGSQKLYVNRGFGFIGYPGRVGILPEITVIELV